MGAGADPLRQLIARIEMLEYSGIRFLVLPRVSRADSVSGITPGEASFQEGDPGSRNADTPGLNGHSATPVPPPGAVAASPEGEVARGDRIVQDAARNWKNSPAASPGAAGLKGKSTDAMAPGAAAESGTSRTEALQAASGRGPETIRVRREDSLFDAAAAGGSRGSKKEALDAVRARAMACTLCPLHKTRTHVVFGDGNPEADLVFVGEAPGADEDAQGLPFVGRAGQLLNKMIAAMGLKREEVYICNVLKCRPPNNRAPAPDEVRLCGPYLEEQLDAINPLVICALGAPAAQTLLRTRLGIGALRGRFHDYRGIPTMATYHPAYVLRSYTEEVRRTVWEDLKKVRAKLDELRAARRAGR